MVKVVRQAEGNQVGAIITRLTATDQDEGLNAQLSYSLRPLEGTPSDVVDMVADRGDVVARTRLDYESHTEYR